MCFLVRSIKGTGQITASEHAYGGLICTLNALFGFVTQGRVGRSGHVLGQSLVALLLNNCYLTSLASE